RAGPDRLAQVVPALCGDQAQAQSAHAPAHDGAETAADAHQQRRPEQTERAHAVPSASGVLRAASHRARRRPPSRPSTIPLRHTTIVSVVYVMASTGKSAPIIAEPSSTTAEKVVNPPHRPVPRSGCSQGRAARSSRTPLSVPRPTQPIELP